MTIVPWATLAPTRSLAGSALPQAPVTADRETALARAWHRITHRP